MDVFLPSCKDESGAYLLDRSPRYFEPLLNYLRTGSLIIDPNVSHFMDGFFTIFNFFPSFVLPGLA